MKKATGITCAFLDVGDVLLTDGWDHLARKRAAKHFKLEWADMEARHQLTFEVFEVGRLTLEEYLTWLSSTKNGVSRAISFGSSCLRSQSPFQR